MNEVERGAKAWKQYVQDIQTWKEVYVLLAEKYARNILPGGELTANDWSE